MSNAPLGPETADAPARVGVDARMLSPKPTGVGNYITNLLLPLCRREAGTRFFLYSNSRIEFPALANVTIREGGARIGPVWLNLQLPGALRADGISVFWAANGIAPVLSSCPTVVTVHDLVYLFAGATMAWRARWTKRLFQGWSVRRAARVVAVSAATAADVGSVYGRAADAVIRPLAHATFHRRDASSIRRTLEAHALPPRYWLFAGTLEPRKNLVSLLEALMTGIGQGLDLPLLVLAGATGWGDPRLNELIRRGEAAGHVRRLGYVTPDDLACLYSGCELLWMPSLYEGFGMPLLEAQRCGAPVLHGLHASMVEAAGGLGIATATDRDSIGRTIGDLMRGEAALTCRLNDGGGDDAAAAADALWKLLCDGAARERRWP